MIPYTCTYMRASYSCLTPREWFSTVITVRISLFFFWREDDYERKVLSSDDHQYQKRTPSLTSSQSGWGELIKRVIQQWPLLCETLIWRWVYPLYLYLCTNVWGNYPLYSCTFVWNGNTVVIMYDLWIYIRKVNNFLGGHWFPPLIKPTTTIWLKQFWK
jgi:hypothetical protein